MGKWEKNGESGFAANRMVLAMVVVLAAVALGAYFLKSRQPGEKAGGGPPQMPPREVAVVTIQPEPILLTTELSGRVSASLVAELRPQVSGIIQKRLFTEGSQVNAGQVLYQIDPAPFQAALEAGIAMLEQQRAVLELALINRGRIDKLWQEGAVSERERDQGATEAEVAQANFRSAEAALETARINLDNTKITAPISGRIGRSSVTMGALVTAFQPLALAMIQKIDPVYVDVSQSTSELLKLRRRMESGQLSGEGENLDQVLLILEDNTEYRHKGTLKFRDVTVDPSTGSVTLRIVFPNPEGILLPGMFVRAVVTEGLSSQALLVPQQGVSRDVKGNPLALVVDAQERVAVKMLTLDRTIGDRWLVSEGIAPGDRVIVEGMQWVRPGSPVKAVPFGKQEPGPAEKSGASQQTSDPE